MLSQRQHNTAKFYFRHGLGVKKSRVHDYMHAVWRGGGGEHASDCRQADWWQTGRRREGVRQAGTRQAGTRQVGTRQADRLQTDRRQADHWQVVYVGQLGCCKTACLPPACLPFVCLTPACLPPACLPPTCLTVRAYMLIRLLTKKLGKDKLLIIPMQFRKTKKLAKLV